MKKLVAIFTVMGVLALFAVSANAQKDYKMAIKTAQGMGNFVDEIEDAKDKIEKAINNLNKLSEISDKDLRMTYTSFTRSIKNIENQADKVGKRSDRMQMRGESYFSNWEEELKQISNPQIRALSEQRRESTQESFRAIIAKMDDASSAYKPFISDLQDIQKFLDIDLNKSSLDSISELIQNANQNAKDLYTKVDAVVTEVEWLSDAISPKASSSSGSDS